MYGSNDVVDELIKDNAADRKRVKALRRELEAIARMLCLKGVDKGGAAALGWSIRQRITELKRKARAQRKVSA